MSRLQWPGLGLILMTACSGPVEAPPQADPATRVLLIGIDGAGWDEMLPLLAAGELPHLDALAQSGFSARLTTMAPALSPVIWTTIATGKSPRQHGIRGFLARDAASGGRYPVTSNLRRTSAIWNILSEAGVEVGVVGWWVTWPAEEVNGWMISPYSAPGQTTWKGSVYAEGREDQTWPRDYLRQIAGEIERGVQGAMEEFGELFPVPEGMELPDYLRAFLKDTKWVHVSDRIFRDVALKVLRDRQPGFLAVYLGGVDVTGHRFWRFTRPGEGEWERTAEQVRVFRHCLENYYRWVDEAVGRLVAAAPAGTTTVVVSDHGMELRANRKGRPPTPQNLFPEEISGGHVRGPDGILIVSGPRAARNFHPDLWREESNLPRLGSPERPAVIDVTPSLLYLFGLPVGRDMEGRVLTEMLDGGAEAPPIDFVATWDDPGRYGGESTPIQSPRMDEVMKRLEGLGYIDND